MEDIKLDINEKGHGAFIIKDGDAKLGEMVIGISGDELTVFHTEVDPAAEGKGFGKLLVDAMADHARAQHLKVKPLCTFVQAQFKQHPELYADISTKEAPQS